MPSPAGSSTAGPYLLHSGHNPIHSTDLATGLTSFERGTQPTKNQFRKALESSEEAVSEFLENIETSGDIKSWNGPPSTVLGYLIAHEAHHRGLSTVALRMSGTKLPKEVVYGICYWSKNWKLD